MLSLIMILENLVLEKSQSLTWSLNSNWNRRKRMKKEIRKKKCLRAEEELNPMVTLGQSYEVGKELNSNDQRKERGNEQ